MTVLDNVDSFSNTVICPISRTFTSPRRKGTELRLGGRLISLLAIVRSKKAAHKARSAHEKNPSDGSIEGQSVTPPCFDLKQPSMNHRSTRFVGPEDSAIKSRVVLLESRLTLVSAAVVTKGGSQNQAE